jgi:uncharacterized protein
MTSAADTVAGESVTLLADRALFWPARATVIVADLHLGKDTSFRAAGIAIPPGGLRDDLTRLAALLEANEARRLVVLGDLTHARSGLSDEVVAEVASWRRRQAVEITVVRGNHDRHLRRLPEEWGMELIDGALLDPPFRFVHHPDSAPERYTWAGHLHPAVRLGNGVESIRLPCYHLRQALGILPAFSRFTGSCPVVPGPGERVFPIVDGRKVFELSR